MCAAGWCSLQPQSTVLMAYQPGASGVPAFSPTVSPGCVTEPARAGTAVQSDRTPAAANFVNLLFICNSPIAPRPRKFGGPFRLTSPGLMAKILLPDCGRFEASVALPPTAQV